MHIPDNYLSPSTCAAMGVVMLPIWKKCANKVKNELDKKKLPLLGICAAFSFLVMMFNVPLPGGTTGHAVGATLAAILLGPYAACISVTIALAIQAIFFGDGGILALGANCFNMAFIMPFIGYYIYKFIKEKVKNDEGEYIAVFIASYMAIVIASFFAAIEFGLQPVLFKDASGLPLYCPYSLKTAIPAMVIPHMAVAGFIEAIATTAVYKYVKKVSPGSVYEDKNVSTKPIYALIAFMIILCPIGLLTSGTAWGEWGAEEIKDVISNGKTLGFVPSGMEKGFNFNALMPDYSINGLNENIGYIISAIAGVLLIILSFKLINKLFNKQVIENK